MLRITKTITSWEVDYVEVTVSDDGNHFVDKRHKSFYGVHDPEEALKRFGEENDITVKMVKAIEVTLRYSMPVEDFVRYADFKEKLAEVE